MNDAAQSPDIDTRHLLGAIRGLVRRFSLAERADMECCGMTVAQAATLEALRCEGAMRQGELSRRLGVSPSTLSRNLERLQERGWVERTRDGSDRRALCLTLSRAGSEAAARVETQELEFMESILERLGSLRAEQLLSLLEALLGAVRDASESCCPGAFDHLLTGFIHPTEQENHDEETDIHPCCAGK